MQIKYILPNPAVPITPVTDVHDRRVRTLTGKEIELDIEADYKVSKIKERVEEKEGIPPAQQRLIYGGKQMCVYSCILFPANARTLERRFERTWGHEG
ncbi:hypothetical protein LTR95_008897 [Oleoguttula sp. CCFEE 5521]